MNAQQQGTQMDWGKIVTGLLSAVAAFGAYSAGRSDLTATQDDRATAQQTAIAAVQATVAAELGPIVRAAVQAEIAPIKVQIGILYTRVAWAEERVSELEGLPADATPAVAIRIKAHAQPKESAAVGRP